MDVANVTVYWIDDGGSTRGERERLVRRACSRCWERGSTPAGVLGEDGLVVSPNGVAHQAGELGDTACGVDATGDDWWWREW